MRDGRRQAGTNRAVPIICGRAPDRRTVSVMPRVPWLREDRWRIAVIIAGAALLFALMETSRNYLSNALVGRPIAWSSAFLSNAPPWIATALLMPLPLWLASAAPITRKGRASPLAIHFGGALLFAALQIASMTLYAAYTRGTFADLGVMISKSSSAFAVSMMMYAAIVGAVTALEFYREARAREIAASQLEASLTQARLAALRGQLNPHFLFNTLNAISTMALADRKDDVVKMLGYLGELLRISLDDERPQEVSLSSEMEFLERYLDIQRARLGDRLTIRQSIDARVLDAMVPSMLLQPLVENAITHGIARVPGPGQIEIRAARHGGRLRVEVIDSGPGPSFSHQSTIAPSGTGTGIGLANTRARLSQLYGDDQTLTLTGGEAGRGGHVTIEIPCRVVPARQRRQAS